MEVINFLLDDTTSGELFLSEIPYTQLLERFKSQEGKFKRWKVSQYNHPFFPETPHYSGCIGAYGDMYNHEIGYKESSDREIWVALAGRQIVTTTQEVVELSYRELVDLNAGWKDLFKTWLQKQPEVVKPKIININIYD